MLTRTTWRQVLTQYLVSPDPTQRRMAQLLLALIDIDHPDVDRAFDSVASTILETA